MSVEPEPAESRPVVINRARLDDLIRAHELAQQGSVPHGWDARRRAADYNRKLDAQRRLELMLMKQQKMMVLPERNAYLNGSHDRDTRLHVGRKHAPRPRPQPSKPYKPKRTARHTIRGVTAGALVALPTILTALAVLLPLWAVGVCMVALGIAIYLGALTAEVVRTTVPASEVEQKKIDWIVNAELADLPDRYTCLDCGRFPEDCVCDEPEGPAKQWDAPCPGAVQMMGQKHDRCLLCDFPVHDH